MFAVASGGFERLTSMREFSPSKIDHKDRLATKVSGTFQYQYQRHIRSWDVFPSMLGECQVLRVFIDAITLVHGLLPVRLSVLPQF